MKPNTNSNYLNLKITAMAISALALLSLAGCGDAAKDLINSIDENLSSPSLMHSWQEEKCHDNMILKLLGSSTRATYEFSGNDVKKTEQFYSTNDCKDVASTVTYVGKFDKKDETQEGVYQIDITYSQVLVSARNEDGQKVLNIANFCGIQNWAINNPVDLTTHARDGLCSLDAMPASVFDIFTIDGNTLYFGKGDDKRSADKRPVDVNREIGFHKL